MMFIKISVLLLLLLLPFISFADTNDSIFDGIKPPTNDFIFNGFKPPTNDFIFNGFKPPDSAFIIKDGIAQITSEGCLMLSNFTTVQKMGHAVYFNPIEFKNPSSEHGNVSTNTTVYSFSTTFVFEIVTNNSDFRGQGIAFFIAPPRGLPGAHPSQFLGLFNITNTGNPANHVFAVELDTNMNFEYGDVDDNHVGIDINGIRSNISKAAGYYTNKAGGTFDKLSLLSRSRKVWVEYDGVKKELNVTLAPFKEPKPNIPLLSLPLDLSPILQDYMYVGFSSGTGNYQASNYILGWSFKINGHAQELNLSKLPKPPRKRSKHTKTKKFLIIGLPIIIVTIFVIAMICVIVYFKRRNRNRTFDVVVDDWEVMYYRSRGYSYKELYNATNGFAEKELVGIGGFGKVYKGILPTSKIKVAIKRVSHDSNQGMKQFIAEIVSIGQLRHRNLVKLMGYCRRQGELLLVYDLMPNGSLDKLLFGPFDDRSLVLGWNQRFQIIKGVASGLAYLHEGCDQVVIHRDIKAGNVLLDGEMNARLGDFGLAKLCERGTNPHTTNVVGTLGYVAPELARTGKATTNTDVFGFGAFLHEVACGKRPIESNKDKPQEVDVLFDLVFSCWKKGSILEISDPKLGNNYVQREIELVLKLGLLCCHNLPESRPSMKQVLLYLDGDALIPASELWSLDVTVGLLITNRNLPRGEILDDFSLP